MPNTVEITAEYLRQNFDYDPATGMLTRRFSGGGRRAGSVVGNVMKDGRVQCMIGNTNNKVHRLVWLYVTGNWPHGDIDHIDGNPSNNRWNNLRDVPHHINIQNRKTHTRVNTLKTMGVTPNRNRFGAQIKVDGKRVWLGTFDTPELANAAYLDAKRRFHVGCTV